MLKRTGGLICRSDREIYILLLMHFALVDLLTVASGIFVVQFPRNSQSVFCQSISQILCICWFLAALAVCR